MIGITNGINKKSSDFETINVTLNTNQQSHADIMGVNFTLTYGNYTQTYEWKGSPLTIEVPAFVEYTLSFEGVEGYLKPANASYTAQAENSRSVTFTYKTELVQVTVGSDNGASVSGAKVNINGKQQTWNGSVLTQKVPFGTSYTVSVGELSGFSTPASKSFKAEQAVREVSFIYTVSALKVNILSNQSTDSSWDPTITNIKATVKYGSTTLQVSNGQQVNLPSGVNVTITFPEVEGYLKPEDITFTHNGGFSEKSGTYKCELLTVNVSADSGTPTGFEVTISKQEVVGVATKYTRLEYIESTGSAWMDTGIKPTNQTKLEIKVQPTSGHFYASVNGSSSTRFGVYAFVNGNIDIAFGSSGYVGGAASVDTYPSVIILKNGEITANGVVSTFTAQSSFSSSLNLPLFGYTPSTGITEAHSGILYYCKIYEDDVLVRDYIPALRSDGIAGLYDSVNDTFYASSGTSNFIYGEIETTVVATQTSVTGTYKIPFDLSYRVSSSSVSGYTTPSSVTRIASETSYVVEQQYEVITVKDLSLFDVYGNPIQRSTANCYVVREAGKYKFPLVHGNAIKNGQVNTAAFTNNGGSYSHDFIKGDGRSITTPYIYSLGSSITLSISNSDIENGIVNLNCITEGDINYATFDVLQIPNIGGNIIICAEVEGLIIWSWHIWLWPHDLTPVEITNSTGVKYNIMPVNLASKYDSDGVHIKNWFYQWGRPNPMLLPSAWNSTTDHTPGSITKTSKASNLQTGLANPTKFYYDSSSPYNWFGDKSYYNLWDAACTTTGSSDNDTVKTVYDPCPVGWKVPNGNTYTGLSFISTVNGIANLRRYSGDSIGVKFPLSGIRISYPTYTGERFYVWTSASHTSYGGSCLMYYFGGGTNNILPTQSQMYAYGCSIRPVQDDNIQLNVIMISFTIGGTTYQAESGMTWFEFIHSDYNTGGIEVLESNGFYFPSLSNKKIMDTAEYIYVITSDQIKGGMSYTLQS